MTTPKPSNAGKVGAGAVLALAAGIVAHFEGYIPTGYADPIGIPTICYGHTGPEVDVGDKATKAECDKLLQGDLAKAYGAVRNCITVGLKPHEAAALVSFTYNVGGSRLCSSTLAKLANKGYPPSVWCPQLERYVYAGGIKLRGLVRRRIAERAMCEGR